MVDYWVIDARRLVTHVHREPSDEGYARIEELPYSATATPLLLPPLAVRLADFGLAPRND